MELLSPNMAVRRLPPPPNRKTWAKVRKKLFYLFLSLALHEHVERRLMAAVSGTMDSYLLVRPVSVAASATLLW